MNRVAALVALIALFPLDAQAQAISGGPKLGINISSLTGSDAQTAGAKLGFHAGGFLNVALTGIFSVQPEVVFSQRGANFTTFLGTTTWEIDYIEVPLLAVATFDTGTGLSPKVYLGPQFGFKVGERVGDSGDSDLVRESDFGIVVGADFGVEAPRIVRAIGGGLRFYLGLTTIADGEDFGVPDEGIDLRHTVFSFSAFVSL